MGRDGKRSTGEKLNLNLNLGLNVNLNAFNVFKAIRLINDEASQDSSPPPAAARSQRFWEKAEKRFKCQCEVLSVNPSLPPFP